MKMHTDKCSYKNFANAQNKNGIAKTAPCIRKRAVFKCLKTALFYTIFNKTG